MPKKKQEEEDSVWKSLRRCIHCGADAWFDCGDLLIRCSNYAECGRYMIR